MAQVVFSTPRTLPPVKSLTGRVVVLDIAFAADGMGTPFAQTLDFIRGLDARLAAWVDHHDHERHGDFAADPRFHLATKAQHGACPEMVTPKIVRDAGPVDTIVTHVDLDGLYAAAKWLLDGFEPYEGADADARAVDTRLGTPGPIARLVDKALRARFRDDTLKRRIVNWLVSGRRDRQTSDEIAAAATEFDRMAAETNRLATLFIDRDGTAFVDAQTYSRGPYDKTELLLAGQRRAPVSIVRDSGSITVAAAFDSGLDFVALLSLGGGMPTRVSLPDKRLPEVLAALAPVLKNKKKAAT